MRLVAITNCEPGMEIGRPIFNETGTVLVGVGVSLTKRMIESLFSRNISTLYIKDKLTADIEIKDDVPLELRMDAANKLQDVFQEVRSTNAKWQKTVGQLNVDKLQGVFKSMIHEIKNTKGTLSLVGSIQVHDDYVFAHSVNVTIYTLAIAAKLGLDDKKLNEIAMGGILHDIGKTMIPLDILNKPGKLTNEEFDQIKKHSEYGFDILRKQMSVPLLSAHCAFQHHEKLDGTGYPRNLKGDEIHPYAKMMAVGDVFDALTSNRSYRKAMLPHDAMEILFAGSNTHFQSDLIQTFQKSIASYPVGITVKLSTGETAVVVDYLFDAPGRPIVRVFKDPNGQELDKPYEIDLSKHLTIMITDSDAIL